MDDHAYHVYDETYIPLSKTATQWINEIDQRPHNRSFLNSTSVTKILLRNAPAPTTFTTPTFLSTRIAPGNPLVKPAVATTTLSRLDRSYLSPTEAAKSKRWQKAHKTTYLSNFQHVQKKKKRSKRKRQRQRGVAHRRLPPLVLQNSQKKMSLQQQQRLPFQLTSSSEIPVTSGAFYRDRRKIILRLEQNNHLQMLQDRRVRMESKLHETLQAWTLMHRAVGDAMEILIDSEPTRKEAQRQYPRLLQSMERDRKRLQGQLEKMTIAVTRATEEERNFVEHVKTMVLPQPKTVKPMKAKTSRTLL